MGQANFMMCRTITTRGRFEEETEASIVDYRRSMLSTAFVLTLTLILFGSGPIETPLELPSVFSDHCVLQRGKPVPVWGRTTPGLEVSVRFGGQSVRCTADEVGRWRVDLTPLEASSKPRVLTVTAGDRSIQIEDVLVGEVWICGGQSNMEWPVSASMNAESEIAAGDHPRIREIAPAHALASEPLFSTGATWRVSTPETVGAFTAVGTFFARHLQQELDVPIGLLSINWGGTRAEPWTDRSVLAKHPLFSERVARYEERRAAWESRDRDELNSEYERAIAGYEETMNGWWERRLTADSQPIEQWVGENVSTTDWKSLSVPGLWRDQDVDLGQFDGVVWYRRVVEIPRSWQGKDLRLLLGPIDDADRTYFGGQLVGQTTHSWNTPREYLIPGSLVTEPKHAIVIAAYDTGGAGGMTGSPASFRLELANAKIPASSALSISLAGDWSSLRGPQFDGTFGKRRPTRPAPPDQNPASPGVMFDAMMHPFVPFAVRGAIWYQGESNAGEPQEYRTLLPLMITSWRVAWGENLPFGIVQLAAFRAPSDDPNQGGWAYLRDAQRHTHLTTIETGLVVTTDIGDARDIHPRNKQEVGRRLALWVLARIHEKWIEHSGPTFTGLVRPSDEGGQQVFFRHARDLRTRDGGPAGGFGVAGADGVYHWAEARIRGQSVYLRHPEDQPIHHIRYAFSDNPVRANLVNREGLPAEPFRWDLPK